MILALDLGSRCGWARENGPGSTAYGSERFTGALGTKALAFEEWLRIAIFNGGVGTIAIEAPVPVRGKTNLDTLAWLLGAHVIVRKSAVKYDRRLIIVGVGTWRSYFIGCAHAPKVDPVTGQLLKTAHTRRMWLKNQTIKECKARGHAPRDDNSADALGLLYYCRACLDPKNGMNPAHLYAEAA